ncbi:MULTISPECIES: hypothetical protein [unclassified Micromonospora]|uniref:hypothetical protein n=1 Tax=unclassified Micromonospora TaxID=2617518 RepID=UPI002FF3E026
MSRRRKTVDPTSDRAQLVYATAPDPDWPYVALDIMCHRCPDHRLARFLRATTARAAGDARLVESEPAGAVEWTVDPTGPMRLKAHLKCRDCGHHVQVRKDRILEALAHLEATRGTAATARLAL